METWDSRLDVQKRWEDWIEFSTLWYPLRIVMLLWVFSGDVSQWFSGSCTCKVLQAKYYLRIIVSCDTAIEQAPLLYKQLSDSTAGGNEIRSRNLKSVFLRNRSMNSKHPSLTFSSTFDLALWASRIVVPSRIVIEINYISFTKIKSLSRWCLSVLLMRKVTSSFLSKWREAFATLFRAHHA